MKKTAYQYIFLSLFSFLLFSSCKKDFLELTPKGKLIAQTTNDYDLLLSNLDFINVSSTSLGNAVMGDEVAAFDPYFTGTTLTTQRFFRWEDVIYEPDQEAAEMSVLMKNIYTYNKIIEEVMNSTGGTDAQKRSVRAEAMAGRAWTYFMLISFYGKPYNTSTAATDYGFPIITKADVTETSFTRSSIQEVYDFILGDLISAIPNLPVQTIHRARMSKAAAEGILGKVYLFMARYADALPQLNASIADIANAVIPVRLYDYNVTFATGGSFLPIGTFGPAYPTVPNNEENIYAKQFVNNWTFTNNEIVINPQTVALYGASDLRKKFYAATPYPSGSAYPLGMLRRIGPTGTQLGLVVPDLYLLRAEVKARLNDLNGAKTDVESLRIKTMPAIDAPVPVAIATNQTALIKFILEERIREFAVQGYRWFDMRRLSVDPQFSSTVGTSHTLYNAAGAVGTYSLRPERLVLRLPQKIMDQNPGMPNNP